MVPNAAAPGISDQQSLVVGIALVSRGDGKGHDPDTIPHQQQLEASISNLLAGGCDEVVVALGGRIAPVTDTSTTLYLPEWFNSLETTVDAAIDFARSRADSAGFLIQTIDAPDIGALAAARVLEVAERRRDRLVRASLQGQWSQPIYIGADLLDEAATIVRSHTDQGDDRAVLRSLGDVSERMVTVECGDLGEPVL